MSFEDELAKRTASAYETIAQQEEEAKIKARKAMATEKIILDMKELIESEFATVANYYGNAKIHPTHDIENGKIVGHFGTFTSSILEFAADQTFKFPLPAIIGIQVNPNDDLNGIKLIGGYLINNGRIKNVYFNLLGVFKNQATLNNYCYEGPVEKALISEAVKSEIIRLIDSVQNEMNRQE